MVITRDEPVLHYLAIFFLFLFIRNNWNKVSYDDSFCYNLLQEFIRYDI